jgi:hypothetical protein
MRRLTFPWAIPYGLNDYVVTFYLPREALASLGEPAFIETDGDRTRGPREFFWGFETQDGLRFEVCWDEGHGEVMVYADPPDSEGAITALRSLGLSADFKAHPLAPGVRLQRGQARGAVWLFTERGGGAPAAVFSRRQHADTWLSQSRKSGTLSAYPLDLPLAEVEKRFDGPVAGERYEYEDGVRIR